MLGLIVANCGCAATPPWHRGFVDELSGYYDQGVGGGSTAAAADRNAQIALVGYQQGFQVSSITEGRVGSFRRNGDELTFEVATERGIQQISGVLPPGSYVAERWRAQDGSWWSFALSERPGQGPELRRLTASRMQMARTRAVVPGWAQFAKKEDRKGWTIIAGEALSLGGWYALGALTDEYRRRRGQGTPADYRYYDRWSDRFAWGAAGCRSLAGATYLFSMIDGIISRPPTYRLLMTQVHPAVHRGSVGPVLAIHFVLSQQSD